MEIGWTEFLEFGWHARHVAIIVVFLFIFDGFFRT